MSSIFGNLTSSYVTVGSDQTVTGKKRFVSVDNEFDGTVIQPIILAGAETIDPTEISFLAGVSSNIQNQFTGINIVLTGLTALEQALQALEPAPNATTVKINNTLLLDNGVGNSITINGQVAQNNLGGRFLPTYFEAVHHNTGEVFPYGSTQDQLDHQVIISTNFVAPSYNPWVNPNGALSPSNEIVSAWSDFNGCIVVGCESGNVYYSNGAGWTFQQYYDGIIRCFCYIPWFNELWVGGDFNKCPALGITSGKIMRIDAAWNTASIGWNNWGGDVGLNGGGVYCMVVSPYNYLYVGGKFDNTYNNQSLYGIFNFCIVDSGNNMYAIDNNNVAFATGQGNGFSDTVFTISCLGSAVCIGGQFQNSWASQSGIQTTTFNIPFCLVWYSFDYNSINGIGTEMCGLGQSYPPNPNNYCFNNPVLSIDNDGGAWNIGGQFSNADGLGFDSTVSVNTNLTILTQPYILQQGYYCILCSFAASEWYFVGSDGTNSFFQKGNTFLTNVPTQAKQLKQSYVNGYILIADGSDNSIGPLWYFDLSQTIPISIPAGRVVKVQQNSYSSQIISYQLNGTITMFYSSGENAYRVQSANGNWAYN